MVKPSVYLETTIISFLVGWLSRNSLLVASNQELTREWWATLVVVDEARKGEARLASERLEFSKEVALLDVTADARKLAAALVRVAKVPEKKVPEKAEIDALHIAVAAISGMTYLLSWNCTHIVNAVTLPRVYDVCRHHGYEPPFICTPQELMEI